MAIGGWSVREAIGATGLLTAAAFARALCCAPTLLGTLMLTATARTKRKDLDFNCKDRRTACVDAIGFASATRIGNQDRGSGCGLTQYYRRYRRTLQAEFSVHNRLATHSRILDGRRAGVCNIRAETQVYL